MNNLSPRPIHIMLPCPPPSKESAWGDYYFGQSLAAALKACGHSVTVGLYGKTNGIKRRLSALIHNHRNAVPKDAVELVICGKPFARKKTHRPRMIWLISHSDRLDRVEAAAADHLFVASTYFATKLRREGITCEHLLQCTDSALFGPHLKTQANSSDILFVGNRQREEPRPVVENTIKAGFSVNVWGGNWEGEIEGITFCGTHVQNKDLGACYASAGVVLNDHRRAMLTDHFISNRIYDVLACGRPIVTEAMAGIPAALGPGIHVYKGAHDLADAINAAQATDPDVLARLSELVRKDHSFAARAKVISDCVQNLKIKATAT